MVRVLVGRPLIVGHRANDAVKLFRYLATGVDAVEVDVIRVGGLQDDLLVRHPDDAELVLGDLRGEPGAYPLLSELLELLGDRAVLVDIKTRGCAEPLARVVRKVGSRGPLFVSSKYHAELKRVKRLLPRAIVLATLDSRIEGVADYLAKLGVDGVAVKFAYVDEELIAELHDRGMLVAAWVVNDPRAARLLASIGVDIIVTDVPELIIRHLRAGCPVIV